jgi:L-amino acid N-acyltransferase YncA
MSQLDLPEGYELRKVSADEFRPLFKVNRPKLFGDTLTFRHNEALSIHEQEAQKNLQGRMGNLYELYLVLYYNGNLAGWSFGRQVDSEKFYMVNSAIIPEHRQKGLYKALMSAIIDEAVGEGFQIICSRHAATNSAILIPKLKSGFIITSFELSDVFGVLVHLSYFTNSIRRKAMDFRAGQSIPDEELKKYLPL